MEKFYAARTVNGTTVYMAREIKGNPKGKKVDHRSHDTLDNRRRNLRSVTHSQNMQNRAGARRNTLSGVRGVSWNTAIKKWVAYIKIGRRNKYLGSFFSIKSASRAYAKANKKFYGRFGGIA